MRFYIIFPSLKNSVTLKESLANVLIFKGHHAKKECKGSQQTTKMQLECAVKSAASIIVIKAH